jgi:hypothetical protein
MHDSPFGLYVNETTLDQNRSKQFNSEHHHAYSGSDSTDWGADGLNNDPGRWGIYGLQSKLKFHYLKPLINRVPKTKKTPAGSFFM